MMSLKKLENYLVFISISISLFCSLTTTVHARDIFYFLSGESIQLYNRQGVFQKSYPITAYENVWRSGLATNGTKAWIGYFAERNQIDRMPFATAPALDGGIVKNLTGYLSDIDVDGDVLYVTRFLNENSVYSRVEQYNIISGALLESFETGFRSFPDGLTVAGNEIFVVTLNNVSVYSPSGELIRQFVPNRLSDMPSNICSDDTYLWLFWGSNIGYAYDFNGNRVASEDITFHGLSSYDGVDLAWGPDGPNIITAESHLDFGSLIAGESSNLDLIIKNVGNQSLTVTGADLSDTDNFSNTATVPFMVSPGGSQTIHVACTPQSMGIFNASLFLASNDIDEPIYTLSLTGKGTMGRFYVDSGRPTGGDGLSWDTAFDSIDSAMASEEVLNHSEIWVRKGIYDPVVLSKQVGVYGGFYGDETSRNQRNWIANETIIDGGGVSRAVTIASSAQNGTLDGFIVQNGFVENTFYDIYYGAGMEVSAPGFSLVNNIIRNNSAGAVGGGVYVNVDNVSVINCKFLNNTARETNSGGGLYSYANGLHIQDSNFTGNTANVGGGLYLDGFNASAIIERSVIGGNKATRLGGGLCASVSITLFDTLIHDNFAGEDYSGSGIEISGDNNLIVNNTIVNNRTPSGTAGSGIKLNRALSTTMANNIIWGNGNMRYDTPVGQNDRGIQVNDYASYPTISYTTIQETDFGDYENGGPDTNNNMKLLPGFLDIDGPDDNPATWEDNDYRLKAGSICIDAGNGDLASPEDLYANPRFDDRSIHDRGAGTPGYVDIGAHERQTHTPLQFYVDAGATGAQTGLNWNDAFTTINEAATRAVDGAEIWVRSGIYFLEAPIELNGEVGLYGGFIGTENTRYQRGGDASSTIIDGGHKVDHCLSIFDDAIVDNFTITGGGISALPTKAWNSGGGIYVENGSPTISHNIITGNHATDCGAGIYIFNGPSAVIDSCSIFDNRINRDDGYTSNCNGAGIFLRDSTDVEIINCVVAGNLSISGGGGISTNKSVSLMNSTVAFNRALSAGGIFAIWGSQETITITNSIVWGNTAFYGDTQIYGTVDASYSNIEGGEQGTGNIAQSPGFLDAGSWNENVTPNDYSDDLWTMGDYHLVWGSPSIDTGTTTGAPALGLEQTVRPESAGVDMGAYEIVPPLPLPGDVNGDLSTTPEDAVLSLKILTGQTPEVPITIDGDINSNQQVGIEETIYILIHSQE